MKPCRWNAAKNESLDRDRGVSFERIVVAIEAGDLLDVVEHANRAKYPKQRVFIVACDNYAYLVPFVEEPGYIFLKTVIPSRKATRDFLNQDKSDAKD